MGLRAVCMRLVSFCQTAFGKWRTKREDEEKKITNASNRMETKQEDDGEGKKRNIVENVHNGL